MSSRAGFRRLALALPGALEADHHGFPSFRVQGKIFATLPDADHAHLMLAEPEVRAALREQPAGCEELWWGQRLSGVRVALAAVDPDLLRDLLHAAWERRAPG